MMKSRPMVNFPCMVISLPVESTARSSFAWCFSIWSLIKSARTRSKISGFESVNGSPTLFETRCGCDDLGTANATTQRLPQPIFVLSQAAKQRVLRSCSRLCLSGSERQHGKDRPEAVSGSWAARRSARGPAQIPLVSYWFAAKTSLSATNATARNLIHGSDLSNRVIPSPRRSSCCPVDFRNVMPVCN